MHHKPNTVTQLGLAYHRYGDRRFGIYQADRLHHLYIIGQTGTGKSTLLGNLVRQDVSQQHGFCLIDPHGDLASALADELGDHAIYWSIADENSPYGYNPLTRSSAQLRPLIAAGLIETLKKQWADSWGARMEHLLRYAALALLEQPSADISEIVPLFVDKDFRRSVVAKVTDEQVRAFWTQEYPKMNYATSIDGVSPIANKLGAFLANPRIRRALCTPEKPLRFRKIMDDGQALIVNLAKGKIGASSANVLGGLIAANIMHAAFSRHDIAESQRRPFFLYVDEFHSLTSTAFADLLPEARKYALGLVLSHQHIGQTDRDIFDAIIGNVGSIMAFRVGARDAGVLAKQLDGLSPINLQRMPNYHCSVQLMVGGQKSRIFSARTSF